MAESEDATICFVLKRIRAAFFRSGVDEEELYPAFFSEKCCAKGRPETQIRFFLSRCDTLIRLFCIFSQLRQFKSCFLMDTAAVKEKN
jgi:hypothetical protein